MNERTQDEVFGKRGTRDPSSAGASRLWRASKPKPPLLRSQYANCSGAFQPIASPDSYAIAVVPSKAVTRERRSEW